MRALIMCDRPPETVGFVVPPEGKDWEFVFFDSHARPHYGFTGAYLVRGETPDTITSRLHGLFESDLGQEMGADVMTSTYNMFEATVFQLNPESTAAAGAPSHVAEGKTQESTASSATPGSSTQDEGSGKSEHEAEAKPASEGARAPAKKSSRNPGIGMGMRIRRDRGKYGCIHFALL